MNGESRRSRGVLFLAALVYALAVAFLPWAEWRRADFVDVANYERQFLASEGFVQGGFATVDEVVGLLTGEYLWRLILASCVRFGIEFASLLTGITLVTSGVGFLLVARSLGIGWAFVLMANPILLDLYVSQVRGALASTLLLTVLVLAASSRVRTLWLSIPIAVTALIHTSMVVLGGIGGLARIWARRPALSDGRIRAMTVGLAAVLALAASLFANQVLSGLGDRRVLRDDNLRSTTYVAYWVLLGLFLALRGRDDLCRREEGLLGIGALLLGGFGELLGVPLFRFVAMGLPMVLASFAHLPRTDRTLVSLATALYGVLQFVYWLGL